MNLGVINHKILIFCDNLRMGTLEYHQKKDFYSFRIIWHALSLAKSSVNYQLEKVNPVSTEGISTKEIVHWEFPFLKHGNYMFSIIT